jgi:hypothetical protein
MNEDPLRPGLLAALLAAMVVGCASPAPKAAKPSQVEPPPPEPVDPSYDWRGLLPAPFGSYLKDVPLALHEVLLFRDDAPGAGKPDDAECYGADSAAPRFVGGTPDEYLLCFKQDRLARIRASVSVSTEQAPEIFATACALWLKNAASTAAATAPTAAVPSSAVPPSPSAAPAATPAVPGSAPQDTGACDGRDGTVHFSGRLGEAAVPTVPAAETPLSIVLDGAADPTTPPE